MLQILSKKEQGQYHQNLSNACCGLVAQLWTKIIVVSGHDILFWRPGKGDPVNLYDVGLAPGFNFPDAISKSPRVETIGAFIFWEYVETHYKILGWK